jgi:hypothetical protein
MRLPDDYVYDFDSIRLVTDDEGKPTVRIDVRRALIGRREEALELRKRLDESKRQFNEVVSAFKEMPEYQDLREQPWFQDLYRRLVSFGYDAGFFDGFMEMYRRSAARVKKMTAAKRVKEIETRAQTNLAVAEYLRWLEVNPKGKKTAGQRKAAEKVGVGVRTLQKALKKLRAKS